MIFEGMQILPSHGDLNRIAPGISTGKTIVGHLDFQTVELQQVLSERHVNRHGIEQG